VSATVIKRREIEENRVETFNDLIVSLKNVGKTKQ
jgi:hypothetical protein